MSQVACSLSPDALAERRAFLREHLFARVVERIGFGAGYAYQFPNDDGVLKGLLDFVAAERSCCSFFRIELVLEPTPGPIWLRLSGAAGVKEFIAETFHADQNGVGHVVAPRSEK